MNKIYKIISLVILLLTFTTGLSFAQNETTNPVVEGGPEWSTQVAVELAGALCAPVYEEGCWSSNTIHDFILNEIENTSSGCGELNGNGWSQYLDLYPALVEAGETYTCQISTGSNYHNEHFTIWVDWNNNMQFEQEEMVVQGLLDETWTLFDYDFSVPADAPDGLHYMRIRTNYGAEVTDPCASYYWGEAEDYYINVGEYTMIPPSELIAELTASDVHLEWLAPEAEVIGYHIYRDDEVIGYTEENYFNDLELADGSYSYCVRALYDEGESAPSGSASVQVGHVLCAPQYLAGCGGGDGITDFALEEIENYGSGCDVLNGRGWSQYMELGPAHLEAGMSHTMTISSGYNDQYVSAWIDWNDNWVFDEDEKVVENFVIENGNELYDIDFVVPEEVCTGIYRLRVRTNYNLECNDPCMQYYYGEAEDYLIEVGNVGIVEEVINKLQVYPNPATNLISVDAETKIERIELVNNAGQMVFAQEARDSRLVVDVSVFSSGIYILKVYSQDQIMTRKFIID